MLLFRRFLANHVLANLTFVLVLILGILTYINMPRARDPDINFNWVNVTTVLPGASSIEVEKRITDPLEDKIRQSVKDIRFISSSSRESISMLLVRFDEMDEAAFAQRLADLRREVQNIYTDQLPDEARDPIIRELNTSSGFPAAVLTLFTQSFDDNFRRYAALLEKELERLDGVDSALVQGVEDPELHIEFYPERLVGMGISAAELADTVRAYFRDTSIGDYETEQGNWVVRLAGTSDNIETIESFPVMGANGMVTLGSLADIYRGAGEQSLLAQYQGKPAVMISITKKEGANTLALLDGIKAFTEQKNKSGIPLGFELALVDDQSISTREAIGMMQQNAGIGLLLVLLVTYLFLGWRISILTSIGIPFTLAGTFFVVQQMGMSLNTTVLLGVVISLGMLVDDAVVVVETIYYRLQRGEQAMDASVGALKEVFAPVLTSVMTTIAVFAPLIVLPGIMGEFLRIIPIVVCVALLISLVEAFWLLPAHVQALRVDLSEESPIQRRRRIVTRRVRHQYTLLLLRALRRPWLSVVIVAFSASGAIGLMASGAIEVNIFAADPFRLFYVNAESPKGTTLEESLARASELERIVQADLKDGEVRASLVYSGQILTDVSPLFGDNLGQVFFSLNPHEQGMRSVYEILASVEAAIGTELNGAKVSLFKIEDGPPVGAPINLKVRGQDFEAIQAVIDKIATYMDSTGLFKNQSVDFKLGGPELLLTLNGDAIKRAGISPMTVTRNLQSYVDGELITSYQSQGEEVDVRLIAKSKGGSIDDILRNTIVDKNGQAIELNVLVDAQYGTGYQNIRHYNYSRAVTLTADIDITQTNTVKANALLKDYWQSISADHSGIDIDYTGELDDLFETLDAMVLVFSIGLGVIYLILGTQFKSYTQPLLVLLAIPLAFIGVVYGLAVTKNPLSMLGLYGVVALSGISVNSAIVLISAANTRIDAGLSPLHATIFAARRRVIPILITSTTTIAGLLSLALGIGGKSLLWGPIASSIVSGLMFSTGLILIVIPLIYYFVAQYRVDRQRAKQAAATQ